MKKTDEEKAEKRHLVEACRSPDKDRSAHDTKRGVKMLSLEDTIKSLKALIVPLDWDNDEQQGKAVECLFSETDRGAIIMTGGFIEQALDREILESMLHLNSQERAALFGFNSPIGTFSAKIKIAHALGIIDRPIAKKIDLLREMRNAAAHSMEDINFNHETLIKAVRCLASDMRVDLDDETVEPEMRIRNVFNLCTLLLLGTIKQRDLDTAFHIMVASKILTPS